MNEKYCTGCGVKLQYENVLQEGYTTSCENELCQRCFRLKNYGEYQVVTKSNEEYIEILKSIGETKDLVLYITDLLNIEQDLEMMREYIPNKMILVLNKRDVIPKSVKDEKIISYFKQENLDFLDVVVISAAKNYNIDVLLKTIKFHQTSKNVYVVGHTNAGKSSLINQLLKNYSNNTNQLTISPLPSTTLNKISIDLNEFLTLIDTPGLVDRRNIVNYLSSDQLKKVSPKKEIKPKTYQLKKGQALLIEDIARIDYVEGERNSFTLYISNELKVKRINAKTNLRLKDLAKESFTLKYYEDIVMNGLGFVKIVDKGQVDVYINQNVQVFVRNSLI